MNGKLIDTLKKGGPLVIIIAIVLFMLWQVIDKALDMANNHINSNTEALIELRTDSNNNSEQQIDLLEDNNRLLEKVIDKL